MNERIKELSLGGGLTALGVAGVCFQFETVPAALVAGGIALGVVAVACVVWIVTPWKPFPRNV